MADDEDVDAGGDAIAGETDPCNYDPSLGDRTRAFVAGARLGELGYWMADRGLSPTIKVLAPPVLRRRFSSSGSMAPTRARFPSPTARTWWASSPSSRTSRSISSG